MTIPFAQLEIHSSSGASQEFLLDRDLVSIGRAPDNALILNEPAISRYHARIAREADRFLITDLGSSNGTRVNDAELPPRTARPLADGDVIRIGTFELRFSVGAIAAPPSPLPRTIEFAAPSAPLLRVSTPQGTRDFPLERDTLVLGRDPASDIVIDVPIVSARHAQLKWQDTGYEITDLGSKNGLFFQGQRIAQKLLADGDALYIGTDVTLTYRAARSDDLSRHYPALDLHGRATLSLGRDPKNDSVIDHPAVSRFHARITRRTSFPLSDNAIIGRQKGCTVRLTDTSVSRRHAQLRLQDDGLIIEDLDSANGTLVNGRLISEPTPLQDGDELTLGGQYLRFK